VVYQYRTAEKQWPVLLHANVCVRRGEGTRAWISVRDTMPPNNPEDAFKVTFESDSIGRSPWELIDALQRMIIQLERQLLLAGAIRR
jgi:hypothetical protein